MSHLGWSHPDPGCAHLYSDSLTFILFQGVEWHNLGPDGLVVWHHTAEPGPASMQQQFQHPFLSPQLSFT